MNDLQSIFSIFLNPVSVITSKINEKVRNVMITTACFCLVGYFIIYFNPSFHIRYRLTFDHAVCSLFLFVLIVFSTKNNKHVKWNAFISWLFFLSGFGVLLISFLHPVGSGYRAFALLMMFGFPCLYYVWNNRGDYRVLYDRLSASTAVIGLIYYVYCFYLAEHGLVKLVDNRVKGRFSDANMFSMLGMIVVCAALYMLLVNRNNWLWFTLCALSMGAGISIMKMGVSRLAILVALGSMIAFSIYYFKIQSEFTYANRLITKLIRAWLLLIAVIVFLLAGNLMLEINARTINEQVMAESIKTETIDVDAINDSSSEEISTDTTDVTSSNVDATDRFKINGKDLDAYTAGRYHIWIKYAQFLNLLGNDFSKADWNALTWNTVKHAHNNFLEIAYRCGVPVACLHTLLELAAGIVCLIWLFGRKYKDPIYFFSITFMICYTVQSLFDIATLPFERPAPFFFYMAMIPIFMFGSKSDEEKDELLKEAAE